MDSPNVRAIVTASREVAHASCNLAAVAALVAKTHAQAERQFANATEASMIAAKVAFQLDDIYRRQNGTDPSVEAADHALEAAMRAIAAAREAIHACRTVPVTRSVDGHGRNGA